MKRHGRWHFPSDELHFVEEMRDGKYQHIQRVAALTLAPKNGIAIDVGANIGLWTVDLAYHHSLVHAFEPVAENVKCLRANLLEFGVADRVVIHECALSDQEDPAAEIMTVPFGCGHASMNHINLSHVPGVRRVPVKTKTLDDFSIKGVTFIKIDVQGYESKVLRGAVETLQKYHPVVCVELVHRTPMEIAESDEAVRTLKETGYRLSGTAEKEWIFVPRKS